MKKGYIISSIIVGVVIIGVIATGSIYEYSSDNVDSNSNNKTNLSATVAEQQIIITKIPNSKAVNVKVDGDNKVNTLLIKDILIGNNISGINMDIKVDSAKYYTVNGSDILKACEKQLGVKIPQSRIDLANIIVASSSGLARMASQENIYNLITDTLVYFKNNHSESGLEMGEPNRLISEYAPNIKNDDGADSLYVQMCIFLNAYYNDSNNYYNNLNQNSKLKNNNDNVSNNSNTNSNDYSSNNNLNRNNNHTN